MKLLTSVDNWLSIHQQEVAERKYFTTRKRERKIYRFAMFKYLFCFCYFVVLDHAMNVFLRRKNLCYACPISFSGNALSSIFFSSFLLRICHTIVICIFCHFYCIHNLNWFVLDEFISSYYIKQRFIVL